MKYSANILEEIFIVDAIDQEIVNVDLTYLVNRFAKYEVAHAKNLPKAIVP